MLTGDAPCPAPDRLIYHAILNCYMPDRDIYSGFLLIKRPAWTALSGFLLIRQSELFRRYSLSDRGLADGTAGTPGTAKAETAHQGPVSPGDPCHQETRVTRRPVRKRVSRATGIPAPALAGRSVA